MKIRFDTKQCNLFYIYFYIMLTMIFVKHVMDINIPKIMIYAIIFLIAFFGKKDEIITVCLSGIPLYTILELHYIIVICLLIYVLKFYKNIKVGYEIITIIALFLWEILHCLRGNYINNASIVFILPYLFCVVTMYNSKNVNYAFVIRSYATATLWMCAIVLMKTINRTGINILNTLSQVDRFGIVSLKESEAYMNPNTLGFLCLFAAIGLIQLILLKKGRTLDKMMVTFLLVFGCLTMSVTYYVCMAILLFLLMFVIFKNKKNRMKYVTTVFLMIIFCVFILKNISPLLFKNLLSRISVDDVSNGRFSLFSIYNKYIFSSFSSLFLGTGISKNNNLVVDYFNIPDMQVPHNGIQEILVIWGIPGLIFLVTFIISIILHSKKQNKNQNLLNYIPLLMIFLKVQAGQLVTSYHTILMFSMAYLSLSNNLRYKESAESKYKITKENI